MEEEKNAEINTLKQSIDQMSQQFAQMLKQTLDKMKERIDWANKEWDKENDSKLLKNFEQEIGQK